MRLLLRQREGSMDRYKPVNCPHGPTLFRDNVGGIGRGVGESSARGPSVAPAVAWRDSSLVPFVTVLQKNTCHARGSTLLSAWW